MLLSGHDGCMPASRGTASLVKTCRATGKSFCRDLCVLGQNCCLEELQQLLRLPLPLPIPLFDNSSGGEMQGICCKTLQVPHKLTCLFQSSSSVHGLGQLWGCLAAVHLQPLSRAALLAAAAPQAGSTSLGLQACLLLVEIPDYQTAESKLLPHLWC